MKSKILAIIFCVGAVGFAVEEEKPFLHKLFSDNMVLQRGVAAPIWGWTQPGTQVTVSMAGKSAKGIADAQGKWMAKLGPFTAGGPHELTLTGPQLVTVKNVLVGDVWICSGQSNMEWSVAGADNPQEEIAAAKFPQIRHFAVQKAVSAEPLAQVSGQWQECSPATAASFTAVGYFFGRHLHQELNVPIGLLHTSWGGTIAEAWTSAEALKMMPDFAPAVTQLQEMSAAQKQGKDDYDKLLVEWWQKNDAGSANGVADPVFDANSWKTMALPKAWEQGDLPNFDGIVWFRKEIDLPEAAAGKEAMLHLGPIDDFDTTWVNGTKVGGREVWNEPRSYKIPANILKSGRNVIAVRVLDTGGGGGIFGQADQMKLEIAGQTPVTLASDWKFNASTPMAKLPPLPARLNNNPNVVTVLYNAMIAPLVPYAVKGAIWYQGESNASRAAQYQTLLPTMINDWRARFGVGDFPFFIVQLANFMQTHPQPTESQWAELREAQSLTALNDKNTGVAVAIDIGDASDIHPKNKQDVGKRLALNALAIAYGKKIEYCGPVYRSLKIEGNKIRLAFDHIGNGLVAKGNDKLTGFAIAGDDKKFVWADAVIDGKTIIISSPQVEKPVAVRYGWADNPICNLYNKEGLPASPFRTDSK